MGVPNTRSHFRTSPVTISIRDLLLKINLKISAIAMHIIAKYAMQSKTFVDVHLLFLLLFELSAIIPPVISYAKLYFAVSVNLLSLITLTLICPGYCISASIFAAISFAINIASLSEI